MRTSDNPAASARQAASVFYRRLSYVWAAFFYLALILAFAQALRDRPGLLRTSEGGAILLIALLSLALFQFVYSPFNSFEVSGWPMPAPRAWLYFGGQLSLLALLFALDRSFIGLGFAILGQVFGVLRTRHWPLPIVAFAMLTAWPLGLYNNLRPASVFDLLGYAFFIAIFVVIGLLIAHLFEQRYRLLDLVEELRRAKAAVEASASQQEELAVLRERTRLAREMHDSLGHALVLVTVKLEAAERLYRVEPGRGAAELEAVRGLVRETMLELRRSLHDLRAPVEAYHDLPLALARLAAEVSARSGIAVSARAEGAPPAPIAEPLWWIAREAVANLERHANAASAQIELCREESGWRLSIADDGIGIAPGELTRPGHFGVRGMRERAEALGGSLSVLRGTAGGTTVLANIPEGML